MRDDDYSRLRVGTRPLVPSPIRGIRGPVGLYQRILGIPFVYNRIRPLVVGGIDMSGVYRRLEAAPDDVVLDIGCGTGDALNYLSAFARYEGYDVDEMAIRFAQERWRARAEATYHARRCERGDIAKLNPSVVVMAGLLHHLADDEAIALLDSAKAASRLRRIVTQDIVFLPGHRINNLFAHLDRGRHCRSVDGYRALVGRAGLRVLDDELIRSHPKNGRVKYQVMAIAPG